ncbi:Hydroxyethylthiazole kinase [uncultured delta proteobacterium]|uniref:Hydroxyethylthiazole kinase n=1 Tax=uncultured delta proteobacterium TaxID=34034 RepID=A0A212KFW6_9DELT|nr:Hydroxyethylthiazole kinase [uncultured delta proteobacterium]
MKNTQYTLQDVWNCLEALRKQAPLVHNITNFVVMEVTANALLAIGASPVMAHELDEVEEITGLASALVLNIGTLSRNSIPSMHKALETALARNIPVVIDPVGAGASRLRTATALALLEKSRAAMLRGNASEILTLAGHSGRTKGVDSTASSASAVEAAKSLARQFGCAVSVSGETDLVTDGERLCFIHGGDAIMPRVTGMGCSASALAGAFAGVCNGDRMLALIAAMSVMAAAGFAAARKAAGPGSFRPLFLDALYAMDQAMLEKGAVISYE